MFRGRDARLRAIRAGELDEIALAIVLALPLHVVQRARDTTYFQEVVRERMPGEVATVVDNVVATIQRRLGVLQ